jgi:hypothetical protein
MNGLSGKVSLKMKRLTEPQQIQKAMSSAKAHNEANTVKDHLWEAGYFYTISIYGVIWNPETKKYEYRRIEVFLNGYPDQIDVEAIHNFFRDVKPYQYYTLWAYNIKRKELIMIKGFD